jgi:hypothetical protein
MGVVTAWIVLCTEIHTYVCHNAADYHPQMLAGSHSRL